MLTRTKAIALVGVAAEAVRVLRLARVLPPAYLGHLVRHPRSRTVITTKQSCASTLGLRPGCAVRPVPPLH